MNPERERVLTTSDPAGRRPPRRPVEAVPASRQPRAPGPAALRHVLEGAQQDRARLASIVEYSDDAILSKDLNGTILTWNAAAERLFGYAADEIVGRSIHCLIPEDRVEEERMILARVARGERVNHYETVRRRKDGGRVEVSITVSPIRDGRGRIIGASKVLRDIGERRRTETLLRDSEGRFRDTFEHAPVGIEQVALDDGRLLAVNERLCVLLGYSREELLGKTFEQMTLPADLPAEQNLLRRLGAGELPRYTIEKRYLRKEGRPLWVRVTTSSVNGERARPYRISIVEDITEQKRTEAALRDSERRMRAIVETAVDAIITIDPRGTIQSVNASTERLFGYGAAELAGRNINVLMPEPYHSEHDGYLHNYLRTGKARIIGIGREVTAMRKDGSTFPINLSISEVRSDDDRLFIGMVHDLSTRRALEREIVDASANEQRRIGQDLHDGLCQDLIGIAFQADFAARRLDAAAPAEAEAVRTVAAAVREAAGQARRLAHGLNPVDLAAGGLPTALDSLAGKISQSFDVACTFRWDGAAEVGDDAAATHLYRIAQEAVSNAIKHGNATRLGIRLAASDGRLVMSVRDNGRGLQPPDPVPPKNAEAAETDPRPPAQPNGGIGLQTMRYRTHLVGGTFAIGPAPRGGTLVTCSVFQEHLGRRAEPPGGRRNSPHPSSDKLRPANRKRSR